ncbi:MAG: glutamate racemase [Bacteroidales bacterium]|nr:glutamate racemase [Bacteroidales bacterium]
MSIFASMIGIFDSGSGGLSVLREIIKILPKEKYVFFADNAFCPYGEKTPEFIRKRGRAITDFLIKKGADIIVVACNTATAATISTLRKEYSLSFIGMEPAVKPAALSSETGVIGVLATAGTLKGSKYLTTKGLYEDNVKIVEHVGKGFVELVERGVLEGHEAEETVKASLQPLLDAGADRIVLGCTHYPFLAGVIQKIAGPDVKVIDPAPAVARHLENVMRMEDIVREDGGPSFPDIELVASGDPAPSRKILDMILNSHSNE